MQVYLLYVVVSLAVTVGRGSSNFPGVKTTEPFDQSESLDKNGNYLLFWNYNDTHVTFEAHVKTRGWVGFGFSDNGNMYPADVVIGWIDDQGNSHFADRYATTHEMPREDVSQDWFLLFCDQTEFGTVLKFVRRKNTCDEKEDKVIQDGTSRIIFAYNDEDPASDHEINYHGQTRGTKSVSLFSTYREPENLPDDVTYYDFLNQNFIVPSDKTTYWCRGFLMPEIGKHHLIEFEPVITPGNELLVHHILLYRCAVDNATEAHGMEGHCYVNRPAILPKCYEVFLAWAIGGKSFYMPEDVGLPVGDPSDPSFYIMETHYDNQEQRSEVMDNSGLRMTLTKKLRKHDAGLLMVGQSVNVYQVVPPHQEAFLSKGYCSQECISQSLEQDQLPEVKVFAACQHSHLLGAAITSRHFKNGTEVEPIIDEPHYDFNFQETRMLEKERVISPGDSLEVDCTYNSLKRNGPTFGGFPSTDEMCLTFMYYYPRLTLNQCSSTQTLMPTVKKMKDAQQVYANMDWNNQTAVDELIELQKTSIVRHMCLGKTKMPSSNFVETEPENPYVPPPPDCPPASA